MRIGPLLAVVALLSGTACARQAPSCDVPAQLPLAELEGPSSDSPRRLSSIGGYTLAISWSPQYCASRMSSPKARLQCSGQMGEFSFILHGLWPEGQGAQRPQYCKPTRLVPDKVIREQLSATPSVQLLQHEWEKHGTCMAQTPAEYFARARSLYAQLGFPEDAELRGRSMTVAQFKELFARANPGTRAEEFRVDVSRDGWLKEVQICLDKRFHRRSCPAYQRGPADGRMMRIR